MCTADHGWLLPVDVLAVRVPGILTRSHLAAFREIVVLANLILTQPTHIIDPKVLYLATTAD
ncbi:hypothetical protein OG352_00615 [Streptomyces sp. NBC_01485]|uniref:hypothetical protein n=1 Tax=Streptomyces sp. NBC_01485 TaxID=2903884 RepID=UPI002E34940F|nr:hypothetical protein [Streptomyces sp. NBC_01485]